MAGHEKGPRSLGTPRFLVFPTPQKVNAARLTPSPNFRVLCSCDSSRTTQFRLSLHTEDRVMHVFTFQSTVKLGSWIVRSLEFRSKASLMPSDHSAFMVSGADGEAGAENGNSGKMRSL